MPPETTRRSSITSALKADLSLLGNGGNDRVQEIPVGEIIPNPAQPRTVFDDSAIESLADSIRENGLLEPILVRPVQKSHDETSPPSPGYELVAGERRWRAFKRLERATIPALVKNISDDESRVFALIENLQREDLTVWDRAQAIQSLADTLGGTEVAAKRLGISRANAFRYTRIAKSHDETRSLIRERNLDFVAADALVSLTEKAEKEGRLPAFLNAAKETVRDNLGVRVLNSRFFDAPEGAAEGGKASQKLKKHAKAIEQAVRQSPFWKTDKKLGLSLVTGLDKQLNTRERQNQIQAAEKYFKAIGAKKVEIRF